MEINVNKIKAFCTRRNFVRMQIQKYACFVFGKELCAMYKTSTLCAQEVLSVLEFMEFNQKH